MTSDNVWSIFLMVTMGVFLSTMVGFCAYDSYRANFTIGVDPTTQCDRHLSPTAYIDCSFRHADLVMREHQEAIENLNARVHALEAKQ